MKKLALLALWASACGSSAETSSGEASYYQTVKPILEAKCISCHSEGGIGPFALTTFDEVKPRAASIAAAVESHSMPPWPPNADCNQYQADRSLTAGQIATLGAFATSGASAGSKGNSGAPLPPTGGGLSRIDHKLSMAAPYKPKLSPDEYRCFIIPWPRELTNTTYVTGFNARPGNASIVHHIIAYVGDAQSGTTYDELEKQDPEPGFTCFGGPGGPMYSSLGGWAPGSLGSDLPAGTGIPIKPGSLVILQVHYNQSHNPNGAADQTAVEISVAPSVEKSAAFMPFLDTKWLSGNNMLIPMGMPEVKHSYTGNPGPLLQAFGSGGIPPGDFLVYSAALHMHELGTKTKISIERAGGASECLLQIDDWDFHWQGSYALSRPTLFRRGDQMRIDCTWDNSAAHQPLPGPPHDVRWGEGTGDEMCIGFLYVTRP